MRKFTDIPNALKLGHDGGAFKFESPLDKGELFVIASNGLGWEHVSVSRKNRCPNWPEMNFIKDMFFYDDEVVVQYHPKKEDYINNHSFCLHMWRPLDVEMPTPPSILVGYKELNKVANEQL